MGQNEDAGRLPGWTLLVGLVGWVIPLMILAACQEFGLPWVIGIPVAIAVLAGSVLAERKIERKYLGSQQR
ncbi:hypothetical protein [Paraburkholderia phytofirmans]|uniref:Transmembrane protein n=1 Tax=Paraburkholderia phytofirmans (strain DSM 17436 / LMG 22146 / PsJN) TaxID=398527 RepID=B2TGU9_PARPJ|nr:hypothetical protein [Paraburkholderia phytofirmans]ACD21665.1 hypothetical protein Bphyt_7380 [Paraburkholderia phytofirmans PsJN]